MDIYGNIYKICWNVKQFDVRKNVLIIQGLFIFSQDEQCIIWRTNIMVKIDTKEQDSRVEEIGEAKKKFNRALVNLGRAKKQFDKALEEYTKAVYNSADAKAELDRAKKLHEESKEELS
jgi:hypothetical protein